jgi:hypothetical protein
LYGLKFYVVDSSINFLLFFAFFLNFFSEIVNFRRPAWPPKIRKLFSALVIFGGCQRAAGNYLLFLATDLRPPKISYFRRLDLGRRKYGLIFG